MEGGGRIPHLRFLFAVDPALRLVLSIVLAKTFHVPNRKEHTYITKNEEDTCLETTQALLERRIVVEFHWFGVPARNAPSSIKV